jgi:hypothetical protein
MLGKSVHAAGAAERTARRRRRIAGVIWMLQVVPTQGEMRRYLARCCPHDAIGHGTISGDYNALGIGNAAAHADDDDARHF